MSYLLNLSKEKKEEISNVNTFDIKKIIGCTVGLKFLRS